MITSFEFSQRFDTVTILSTGLSSLFALLRTLALLLLGAAALAGVFALVIAFWLSVAQVAGALAIIGGFPWVTYPPTAARKG